MDDQTKATPVAQSQASSGNKNKPEQFIDKVNDQSVELKSPLPPRFQWRGVNYITKDLTPAQIKAFAEDKGFPHIVPKGQ